MPLGSHVARSVHDLSSLSLSLWLAVLVIHVAGRSHNKDVPASFVLLVALIAVSRIGTHNVGFLGYFLAQRARSLHTKVALFAPHRVPSTATHLGCSRVRERVSATRKTARRKEYMYTHARPDRTLPLPGAVSATGQQTKRARARLQFQ